MGNGVALELGNLANTQPVPEVGPWSKGGGRKGSF
jgi:hypothetical protein